MTAGLILAAGEGRRFGSSPKLLEPLDGRPLLEHALAGPNAVDELAPIIVVLGANADRILAEVDLGRAEPVVCARWHEGLSASLRCGVAALGNAGRVLVTLGDGPDINPAVIRRVLRAGDGARAAYNGRPGHPVLLGESQLDRLRSLSGDVGARELLSDGQLIECSDLCAGYDVDTPRDLEAIRHATRSVL